MVSGYNSVLLNEFSEKGIDSFNEITPFKMVKDILDNPRYDLMYLNQFEELNEKNEVIKNNNYVFHILFGLFAAVLLKYFLILVILITA